MILQRLDISSNKEYTFVENLYIESFPLSERRPVEKMFNLYKENPRFTIAILIEDEQLVGFLTYWDLDTFIYAEHFAISPEFRNGGYGKKVMDLFIEDMSKPIILEVELPTTILSERRIGFYQRIGFKLWENIQYQQPPYIQGGSNIPMKLMSIGDIDLEANITEIRSAIYSNAYGC
ncbi:GNAT family N-acetyltransferase [Dysgonomonas sp. ZJ279]|uniref:GNAT family N-acetyltransferase n=1 Tax=Dysgonomonas sp. ZJ279 TaxID=2709796 RepID=UPI0013ED3274|nr:GNAT family N-acetyltransferase [Dysgonomonas sp. ZJ279]